ncbi:MAG: Gfo/Idh/MocA family protein [Candidatus Dormibacteria bacterium]
MNRKALRWGVLGAARIASRAVVPAILAAGDEVGVLGCRDLARGLETAARLGIPKVVEGYQRVLEEDLDAVYIPLPNSLHLPWALAALESGKHVLCEKPLALSADQAVQMGAVAQRLQLVLAEAVMYRYHPRWRTVMELVRQGRLGSVRHIAGAFSFRLRPPPDVRWEKELGGGALYDVGSYLINAARWVAGREPQRAVALAAPRYGVDESTTMTLDFPARSGSGAVTAAVSCSFAVAGSQWLVIEGEEAVMFIAKPFTAWHGEHLPIVVDSPLGRDRISSAAADPYREMVLQFQRSVESGEPIETTATDAAGTLAVIEACQRSSLSGSWASVAPTCPPVGPDIRGSAEAE